MMLVKYRPYSGMNPIDRARREFLNNYGFGGHRHGARHWGPRVDISEDKDAYFFQFELPGFSKDDVKVSLSDENILTVKGELEHKEENEQRKFWRVERNHGGFERSFEMPDKIDRDKIEAEYKHGILNLRIEKLEAVKPRDIEIK